nr:TetR/AcrR family transcriptional regulator [Streptomyces sp. SID5914]
MAAPERRRLIIEAAKQVFLTRGLAGARTKDIATAAGVNEALIYRHFDSKEEIFVAAVVEPLQTLVDAAIARAGHLATADGDLQYDNTRLFITELLQLMIDVVPLLGVVLFSEHEAGIQFYRTEIAPGLDAVTAEVEQRMPDWNHRDFQPRVVTTAGWGICLGIALDARFRGTDVDVDRTATEITDLIFEGLRPRPENSDA